MTRHDRWELLTMALELRIAARAQSTSLLPIVATPRMVEIAEAMEAISQRVAIADTHDRKLDGFCAWE